MTAYSTNRKRRYNLCCRLRAKGVAIITDKHTIEITEEEYHRLGAKPKYYIQELQEKYHYSVQYCIQTTPSTKEILPGFG